MMKEPAVVSAKDVKVVNFNLFDNKEKESSSGTGKEKKKTGEKGGSSRGLHKSKSPFGRTLEVVPEEPGKEEAKEKS